MFSSNQKKQTAYRYGKSPGHRDNLTQPGAWVFDNPLKCTLLCKVKALKHQIR